MWCLNKMCQVKVFQCRCESCIPSKWAISGRCEHGILSQWVISCFYRVEEHQNMGFHRVEEHIDYVLFE